MKVIFLDIDGVLNTFRTSRLPAMWFSDTGSFNVFDKRCVKRLNRITDATKSKIVISSTWRIGCLEKNTFGLLVKHFRDQGVTGEIVGATPVLDGSGRDVEINTWFKQSNVERFIVLDDDMNFFHSKVPGLIHVENGWRDGGIQDKHVDEAILILNASDE